MEVTINNNGQAVAVEVTLEVYEFLDRADHKTENLFHEQRRHWDGREFDEYIITTEGVGAYGETPEEYLCRMETLHELIAVLTERGEMWAQYNKYKTVHKQFAKVKPEKRELFEQRHSRELILYDAAARYLKELKASGEEITPKEWRREIDLLTAQKQVDSIDMKAMREELKAVERLRKAADQLARQERDKPRDRGPER